MQEDTTSKKFLDSKFNNFKMVDSRPVIEQFAEIEMILNHFSQHKIHMDKTIVVSSIIDKLPPSWRDFKRSLTHKKEEITLDNLANDLRVEEEFRMQDENKDSYVSKVHVVEEGHSSKSSNKRQNQSNDNSQNKRQKNGKCFFCHKEGHYKSECKFLKKRKKDPQVEQIKIWLL